VIRAVLDANTIASGMVRFREGATPPVLILQAWALDRFELITTDILISEVVRTLSKPYFVTRVESDVHAATLKSPREDAGRVEITTTVSSVATHPEDDLVLAAAVSAAADYLVTGDKQLQRLDSCQGVRIVSPREFLTLLDAEAVPSEQEGDQAETDQLSVADESPSEDAPED
jgi:predicted nucleic acid-binding protein